MVDSEYVKSMNCNFARIKLEETPEEKRYQYCIVNRGGIRGLLPCSLRVINGDAFLYYDITSKQCLSQMFRKKSIGRQWIKDFIWNLDRISKELNRFLLDKANVIWYPDNIFQDFEDNRWSFLYYPYYKGENGFRNLLEFIIEKIDYADEELVECVYKIYEQYENFGDDYLSERIFQDVKMLDKSEDINEESENEENIIDTNMEDVPTRNGNNSLNKNKGGRYNIDHYIEASDIDKEKNTNKGKNTNIETTIDKKISIDKKTAAIAPVKEKKGLLSFLENSRKKDKEMREKSRKNNHYILDTSLENGMIDSVAEETDFYQVNKNDSEVGKTVYIEKVAEDKDTRRRIYDSDGKVVCLLEQESVVIGKKKDEADMIIDNSSVSRVHARIYYADGDYVLEDLNSTNGTFKNGLRLRPYEKRRLTEGDEIKLGNVALMYS